ncbi:non-ribosomal peptide synthetase/type I polyketide synthase [Streptomyces meridianus]|uniref:Amino acid adenylation domain-containing protein n=1 Tax=Streptomyces meridianus TaxID=2938945 RepID=A0ABT0XAN3_9ACTN|nr:non-ribosomal peptide synthetase/type I polyketide synthase [Streptomyces meridianus]MCM2579578.1 amino acid adenylation domain-containing protein [Streptomyces meridianus]
MNKPRGLSHYRGPELAFSADDSPTAASALLRAAELFPESAVVTVDQDGATHTLTYAELLTRARKLLTGLRAHGLRPGQHVVLCGLPLAEFFPAFWACALGGIRPVAIAEHCGEGTPALERLRHTGELLGAPVVLSDRAGASSLARTDPALRVAVAADCLRHEPAGRLEEPAPGDVALLMLSSGSTGLPKAAQLTHGGLAEFAASTRRILGVGPGDVTLNWLPVDHSGAFLIFHVLQVFAGCTNVHVPTDRVLADPLHWLDLLEEHRAVHSWAPAFAFALIADAIGGRPGARWDLSRLRTLLCGGERIPLPVMRRFLDAVAPFGVRDEHIVPAWGMAETVTAITYGRLGAPGSVHRVLKSSLGGDLIPAGEDDPDADCITFVAAGSPAHRAELRAVDERGEPVPERRIGRLQVRSARVTPGYAARPEATAEAFPDGPDWLDTGDLAFFADGQVVVTGRRKDVIILNGHNHYSHEIEEVAAGVPGVRTGSVAACGVPDRNTGSESLALFFVSTGARDADRRVAGALRERVFTRLRLTADRVVPVPEAAFPRTPAGKVRRGVLRDRLESGEYEGTSPAAPSALVAGAGTTAAVQECVTAILGHPVDPHTPFYELGMNSLLLMRTRGDLERRLGRTVPATAFFEHPTAAALAAHLDAAPAGGTADVTEPVSPATPADRRIAVIGMSARFPGAASVDEFWSNLCAGVDSVRTYTADDLTAAGLPPALLEEPGRVSVAGHLDEADGFDADFFGISRREAELTDPAHRLFLESCHQALEDGGYAAGEPGTRVGVFAGSGMHLYGHQQPTATAGPRPDDPAAGIQAAVGRQPDFMASRVAYRLGLTGPAIGVQTACSTSLVAVHLAAQALLSGDADLALAGAAAVHTPQESGYRSHPGSILSPTGRCRAFDADADGTVGGSGVAAVLLKRLDRALADGDTVHAVIIGSAVNNDGSGKVGFTAPGVAGQVDVVRQALHRANVPADTVSYVEAHGTGTRLGDPVEFEALSRALGEGTGRTGFCALGSVKPNIGHLDSCAGMAGLIKTVLMLRHGMLVPTLNLTRPNPALRLEGSPFVLATELRPWPTGSGLPRRAGVCALGVGGTNAHVLLEETPPRAPRPTAEGPVLVPVSAKDPGALGDLVAGLEKHLRDRPGTACADVVRTLALGRRHREQRAAFVARSGEDLVAALARWKPAARQPLGSLAFVFSGQGSAAPGMSRALHAHAPVARRVLEQCEQLFSDDYGGSLLDVLLADDAGPSAAMPTRTAQPALFAHQMALFELWRACGVRPALLMGHSLGEYAALCAAGAVSLADGLRLTARRGLLMQETPPGAMLAVRCDRATADRIAQASGTEPAAVNGPRSQVLSGAAGAIREAAVLLDRDGIPWRALSVDRAFHTSLMDSALAEFRSVTDRLTLAPLSAPFVGGLDGVLRSVGRVVDAGYLHAQAREAVRFDLALRTAAEQGCADFLEIGAAGVLAGPGRQCLPGSRWVHQGRDTDAMEGLLEALGELYTGGADVTWSDVVPDGGRIPLPGHPLRRTPTALPAQQRVAAARESSSPAPAPGDPSTRRGDDARVGPVLRSVVELTAAQLGADPEEMSPDTSFFLLGADSLSLMGMTRELETLHQVRIPVRELFSTADTPRKLAELVVREGGAVITPTESAGTATGTVQERTGSEPAPTAAHEHRTAEADICPVDELPAYPTVPVLSATDGPAADGLHAIAGQQLRLAEKMVDQVTGLMSRQLQALGAALPPAAPPSVTPATAVPAPAGEPAGASPVPAPRTEPARTAPPAAARPLTALPPCADVDVPDASGCDFSLYFFGDYPESGETGRYDLIMSAAEFADRHGFHTLWFPERHFNSFGSLFPNPSVLAAALAARTSRIRLHAGSVVLPLHHPVRVAEEWSVVDNLSGGRAGMCVASGWHAQDFALAPDNFGRHRELMYEQLDTVRRLWSGQAVPVTAGGGEPAEVRLHPTPVQPQPPLFVAVLGNPDSYRRAAENGLGVVTNLMSQSVEQLAENIALYRKTRADHGLDPAAGRVVVLVHTYLGEDAERARAEAYRPFIGYLRSSLSLFDQVTNSLGFDVDLDNTPEEDLEFLLGRAYERYCESRALIGDERTAAETVRLLTEAGADEIACFVDFGVPKDRVLAALPAIDRLGRSSPGRAAREPERLPLSPAQRRIWFLEKLHPGTAMYHEPKAVRLQGPLDEKAFARALRKVVARQPALRTVFPDDDGVPWRRILDDVPVDCPVEDHTGAGEEEALRSVLEREAQRVFDLGSGPLFSARLLRTAPDVHLLFLRAHHIVLDSASTAVFVRDLAAFYRAEQHGAAPPPPLADRPEPRPDPADTARDLAFWRRELAGAPVLQLPADRPRPAVRSGAGAGFTHEFHPELVAELRRFSADHRVTPFMSLLATICAVLARFSGQDDVVIGTAVGGRPVAAEDEIGLFLDTLALRIDLSGDPGFAELVHRVRESTTTAYEHRGVPFDELVGALGVPRDPSRNPLFQVLVEYENEGRVEFDPPRLEATLLDVPSARAPFDLSIYLTHHRNGLRLMVEYDTALFDEGTVRRFIDYAETALRRALEAPTAPLPELTALTALTAADRSALTAFEGGTESGSGRTLHELFEEQARRSPDAVALITDDRGIGYRELDEHANRLARQLGARGAERGVLVAVLLPRGPELITALLAVLKSGAGYLPLDPGAPTARTEWLLQDGAPALLVTTSALRSGLGLPDGMRVHLVDEAAEAGDVTFPERLGGPGEPMTAADGGDESPPEGGARPEDPAYCIYTSGSTGRPKGVVVPHRGPANLVRRHLEGHEPMRTLQWTSPSFDVSVQELFTTLAAGAALVLIGDETRLDPAAVTEAVRRHGVQRLFMPYTPLRYLMETDPLMPSVREVFVAGEALTLTPPLRRFLGRHPECALYNQYGPTEASVIVTSHRVDPAEGDRPPIGMPVPGVRIRLLDGSGREVPVGAVGEIHVAGVALAHGYHGRPEETAAAFVRDARDGTLYRTGDLGRWRSDGELEYLGRADDQVKIRGFRVEPAEVQAALAVRDDVTAAAVVPRRDRNGETVLAAYVVPARAADGIGHLAAALAAGLPDHLVPRQWVRMDRIPLNSSGKIDRDRLPAPETDPAPDPDGRTDRAAAAGEPSTPAEKVMHEVWCDELGRTSVPVNRSFFELGGHSLSAVRLLNRMTREHGFEMSMADFFRAPTVRAVAGRMASTSGATADRAPMPGTVRRMWRRHHERSDPSVYNVAHRIDLHGELDTAALSHALTVLVRRHAALRSRAVHRDGEYLIEVLADLEPDLPVTDLTAADEERVDRWCREQARRPFSLDTAPLFRFGLARLGEDRWVLVAVLSHAICDGWSMGVLWRELEELHNARRSGREPELGAVPAQFTDYARWEREQLTGARREELEAFWRRELAGAKLRMELPYDRPRPEVLSGEGALHRLSIGEAVAERVAGTAARLGTTAYLVLAGAFAAWAGARSGSSSDVVLAASSANRTRQEFENTVGFIGDAVLLRTRTSGATTFSELVTHLGSMLFPAIDHQALPLEEVVRLAAPEMAEQLFPTVLFTVVTTASPSMDLDGLRTRIRSLPVPGLARNELYVVLVPGDDGIEVVIEYSTDLFDASTIASWGEEFAALLAEVTADPEAPLPGREG